MTTNTKRSARATFMRKFEERQVALFERMAARVNANNDPSVQSCLDATFGRGASLNCLLGSNGVERVHLAERLAASAVTEAKLNDLEMAVVVFRDKSWAFEAQASVLDLPLIRRTSNHLKKLGASAVGVIQIGCLPRSTGDFEYVPQVKAVVFGKELQTFLPGAVSKLQRKYRRLIPEERGITIHWPKGQNARVRYTQVARLFDLGDPLAKVAKRCLAGDVIVDWKGHRHDRAVRRYQVLTMSLLDKMVMATGELAPILEGATRECTSRARKLYRSSDKPLHRDQIVHFWMERQLSCDQRFVLPFVKVR